MIAAFVIVAVVVSLAIAIWTGRAHRNSGAAEFIVGGRSFPAWMVYFLAVGEIYSIGTLLGVPSGIYAKGASYGVWYIGYIVLAYALGYYVAPLLWRCSPLRVDDGAGLVAQPLPEPDPRGDCRDHDAGRTDPVR